MTKEQRREIYWQAYACCENAEIFINRECQGVSGVCDIIENLLKYKDNDLGTLNPAKLFPEFAKQKPENLREYQFYWWPNDIEGWKSRQKALLKAIALTYKQSL
jgi:hypothetical protein